MKNKHTNIPSHELFKIEKEIIRARKGIQNKTRDELLEMNLQQLRIHYKVMYLFNLLRKDLKK